MLQLNAGICKPQYQILCIIVISNVIQQHAEHLDDVVIDTF